MKTQEYVFGKPRENNFREMLGEFLDNFRKIWESTEKRGKIILDKFREK